MAYLNGQLNSHGVYVVRNVAGTGLDFMSSKTLTLSSSAAGGNATGVFGTNAAVGTDQAVTAPDPAATETGNALDAVEALAAAVTRLSTVQGKVGAGLNKLQYSIQLAQSQITNFSAAESRIRDTDVAQEAANLTKAQVLQQASMAAMAQANSAPQAIMSLLRG
jgi:flagellin